MRRHLRNRLLLTTAATIALGLVAAPAAVAQETDTATVETVVPYGSRWGHYTGTPADTWRTDSGWPVTSAPFGRGRDVQQVTTTLPQDSVQQPLATYFRRQMNLTTDLPEAMSIVTWADDGILVYVNGVEVGRANIAAGPLPSVVYATRAPSSRSARATPVTFDVPVALLHEGRNTIAVHVAANWRQSPNVSFDAQITRVDTVAGSTPAPTPTATPAPSPSVTPTATPSQTPTPSPTVTTSPTPTTPPPTDPGVGNLPVWGAPVWRDEFSYRDPATGAAVVDPAKWNVRSRGDLGLLFDAAVPDAGQVTVDSGGVLHIRADWLDQPVIRPAGQTGPTELWHKTGYIDQRKLQGDDVTFAQPYGRWEIRAKTPTGPNTLGSLAAFWLRNTQSGEIDIMEAWGYDDAAVRDQRIDTATTTVHTHTSSPSENRKYIWHHEDFGAATPVWTDFHTYAFELTPTYAAISFDGREITRVTPATHPNLWDSRYFGSPLHMRLNLHVGPSAQYWGLPDPNNRAATQNLDFQVDYVRVWSYSGS